ncbi:MAG: MBL fold metallo-hydrolase, partial [Methanocorpusculum sp.]|nr:MBL fold metallo-hydrolase [Methanocorpusculum sp.]
MEKPIWIKGRAWEANSYIIGNILIDASVSVDKIEPYKNQIDTIVLTHGHFDHFANLVSLSKLCGADVYIGEFDLPFLSDESLSLSAHFSRKASCYPASILRDGDMVEDFQVYHTPGHTKGGICLFRKADGVLISGDTI